MILKNGSIVVISGPSGVGKDTIINNIIAKSDFAKLPTCTTRSKRDGEIDGVHYHFLNEEKFFSLYDENKLLDHVIISGYHYGLLIESVSNALSQGKNMIVHLVANSALLLKHIIPETILIFIMSPSQEELVQRLRNRGMSEKDIAIRLRDDPTLLQLAPYHDFVIVNHRDEEQDVATRILDFIYEIQKSEQNLTFATKKYIFKHMYPQFLATKNLNKLREFNEILEKELQQIEVELFEPQGLDVAEVVKEKAKDAFHKTGKPVIVEDTGLEFSAWNCLPGALIKWFLKSIGNKGILKMLQGEINRQAIAKTAIGFYDGTKCHIFFGEVKGIIPTEIRGQSGFGWDPIFIPEGYKKSFAEMTAEEKNAISMRKLALLHFKEFFSNK